MISIWKYALNDTSADGCLLIPKDAEFLSAQIQVPLGRIVLWFRVDTRAPKERRQFRLVSTGHDMGECATWDYRGTVQDGADVWHLFEQPGVAGAKKRWLDPGHWEDRVRAAEHLDRAICPGVGQSGASVRQPGVHTLLEMMTWIDGYVNSVNDPLRHYPDWDVERINEALRAGGFDEVRKSNGEQAEENGKRCWGGTMPYDL